MTVAPSIPTSFTEHHVEADGFQIRYLKSGNGPPLVHFHGAGGLRLTPAHALLAERFCVLAFELPGFGSSPVNDRSASIRDLARTMAEAVATLGLDSYNLLGTSFGGRLALRLAVEWPTRLAALVGG